jgi:hypothetical protein
MPEVTFPLRVVGVEYSCDTCGLPVKVIGQVPGLLANAPPKFRASCQKGHLHLLDKQYPGIGYERDTPTVSEIIDL